MKKLLLALLVLPTLLTAAEYTSMAMRPNVLELKKYRSAAGNLEVRHIHENPRINIVTGYNTQEIHDFFKHIKTADIDKMYCDGDYFLAMDFSGRQYIHVNSIKVCVDEAGFVVAQSVGMKPLSSDEVQAIAKNIEANRKPIVADAVVNPAVNDNRGPKPASETGGLYGDRLKPAGTSK